MRVATVIGARPQFIKCAAVSRLLASHADERLIHTGQHYDREMSQQFFEQLGIAEPYVNLGIATGPHGQMTGRMLEAIESVVGEIEPDVLMVYGDTNSTMAGALVGAKLHIPVAHVEAGLRSFNRRMPEEINRIVTDHVSSLLFCPTQTAVGLLADEGIRDGVHNVGDVMFDSVLYHLRAAEAQMRLPELHRHLGFEPDADRGYALATVHRAENTDDPRRLGSILHTLGELPVPVLLPLHPRTRKALDADAALSAAVGPRLCLVDPIGYRELLLLASNAAMVLTDSGGLQKEAFFVGTPCITLRDETEWPETLVDGANTIVGADGARITGAGAQALSGERRARVDRTGPFGDGRAAEAIVTRLAAFVADR